MIYFFKELIRGVGYWQFENSDETLSTELFSEKPILEEQKIDFARVFPREICQEFFSYLNLATLGKICLVNKAWKHIASEPHLWKHAIYKEIAFGNDKWAKYFGKEVVKDEDNREEFSSLPVNEFIEDCKKFKSIFPEKKAKDRLMLVRLPKTLNGGLTLKSIGELVKHYFPFGGRCYRYFCPELETYIGEKSIDKSRWVIMTKDILSESRDKSYVRQRDIDSYFAQQEIVVNLARTSLKGYEIPETLEAATCILSQYVESSIRLFSDRPLTYTYCKESFIQYHVIVGDFTIGGLDITLPCYRGIGVAALRKF